MRCSSASTSRVTEEVATPSCRAADEKPPLPATRQNAFSSEKRSMFGFCARRNGVGDSIYLISRRAAVYSDDTPTRRSLDMKSILHPVRIGDLTFSSRVAMAPVTRARAGADGVPVALNASYYRQRASAGLIITEATNVSPNSAAFELAPAIYNDAHVDGWRQVAQAVHAEGGKIFMQLWHSGRVSSYALLGGRDPLSPSGVNDDLDRLQVYGALRIGVRISPFALYNNAVDPDAGATYAYVAAMLQSWRRLYPRRRYQRLGR